jgi:hypothetical protein
LPSLQITMDAMGTVTGSAPHMQRLEQVTSLCQEMMPDPVRCSPADTVPETGSTVMLIGLSLTANALLGRRRHRKRDEET